jgi:hypothetical protein
MVRKTRIDFVNDPVQLAVTMLQEQQRAALSSLSTKKRVSPFKEILPRGINMKTMRDILKGIG